MGLFSRDIKTMDDLFIHTLQDIYYAEQQIVQALPEMIEKATDATLRQGFETHLAETKKHVKRLEQVFELQGVAAKGVDCPALTGSSKKRRTWPARSMTRTCSTPPSSPPRKRSNITRSPTLIAWARRLGRSDVTNLLQQTLDEEKATDAKLTKLAEANVNQKAA
jgi:ferritin-like metal-binding protein YciE